MGLYFRHLSATDVIQEAATITPCVQFGVLGRGILALLAKGLSTPSTQAQVWRKIFLILHQRHTKRSRAIVPLAEEALCYSTCSVAFENEVYRRVIETTM